VRERRCDMNRTAFGFVVKVRWVRYSVPENHRLGTDEGGNFSNA
jgi:hypothetical protein